MITQERVMSISGSRVQTDQGLRRCAGNAPVAVGDMVTVIGGLIIGWNRRTAARPVALMPQYYRFADAAALKMYYVDTDFATIVKTEDITAPVDGATLIIHCYNDYTEYLVWIVGEPFAAETCRGIVQRDGATISDAAMPFRWAGLFEATYIDENTVYIGQSKFDAYIDAESDLVWAISGKIDNLQTGLTEYVFSAKFVNGTETGYISWGPKIAAIDSAITAYTESAAATALSEILNTTVTTVDAVWGGPPDYMSLYYANEFLPYQKTYLSREVMAGINTHRTASVLINGSWAMTLSPKTSIQAIFLWDMKIIVDAIREAKITHQDSYATEYTWSAGNPLGSGEARETEVETHTTSSYVRMIRLSAVGESLVSDLASEHTEDREGYIAPSYSNEYYTGSAAFEQVYDEYGNWDESVPVSAEYHYKSYTVESPDDIIIGPINYISDLQLPQDWVFRQKLQVIDAGECHESFLFVKDGHETEIQPLQNAATAALLTTQENAKCLVVNSNGKPDVLVTVGDDVGYVYVYNLFSGENPNVFIVTKRFA